MLLKDTFIARNDSYIDHYGYRHIRAPRCSRAHKDGFAKEQYVNAEIALGKPLPKNAVIHHWDENKRNNANSNLLLCENIAYHHLIHARQRVSEAGGNPNTDKICHVCKKVKHKKEFYKKLGSYLNRRGECIQCCFETRHLR